MNDIEILSDFFMVDHIAERMGCIVNPELAGESVRALQVIARDENSDPLAVMAAIHGLEIAIGGCNLTAVIAHDLWSDWCPQPPSVDPLQYDNGTGVVIWAGKRGYVKCSETDADGRIAFNLHAVTL